jgi:hypothetical protein
MRVPRANEFTLISITGTIIKLHYALLNHAFAGIGETILFSSDKKKYSFYFILKIADSLKLRYKLNPKKRAGSDRIYTLHRLHLLTKIVISVYKIP